MKLIDIIKDKKQQAIKNNLEEEAIEFLVKNYFFSNNTDYYLGLNEEFDDIDKLNLLVNRYLNDKTPPQYILGYTYFLGLKIEVNNSVLIPRRETEEVTLKAIDIINKRNKEIKVLDLCTGSGCIAISIKKMTKAVVTASDIFEKALEVAEKNGIINNVTIEYIQSDLFEKINDKFDLIISNPPYLSDIDMATASTLVTKNEPTSALYAPDNGLYYYKKILDNVINYLKGDKYLIFEIGDNEKEDIINYALSIYKDVYYEAYKDMQGKDRILVFKF